MVDSKKVTGDTTVLFFADIFGKCGRRAVSHALAELKREYQPDFVIGNGENLAGGRGINKKVFQEMMAIGFHGLTGGNHTWDNKEIVELLERDTRVLRPANFPSPKNDPCPGKGYELFRIGDKGLWVINLLGRVFMEDMDCPFLTVDKILNEIDRDFPILVDMHADATSEKYAMGWHLDGRVSAVVGSHSHVQTADERILPFGTAYITDVGMTGSFDSVIGLEAKPVIRRFMTKRPMRPDNALGNPGISCVVIKIGADGRAKNILRIRKSLALSLSHEDKDDN